MEFVSNAEDMMKVVGTVRPCDDNKGIQMALPEQMPHEIHRIVYGKNSSGKRYIETVSLENGAWPVYGEASILEILVFAEKANRDMPDSNYTKELRLLALRIRAALG